MITDERRQEIAAEEIVRDEIRRSLDAQSRPSSVSARAWALLNSSFVLWLLSSVVVTGLTAAYTGCRSREAELLRRQELVRRLDIEITNRIFYAIVGLQNVGRNIDQARKGQKPGAKQIDLPTSAAGLYRVLLGFLNNTFNVANQDYSVFIDFKSRTFTSLLLELKPLVDPSAVGDIDRALAAYVEFAKDSSSLSRDVTALPREQLNTVDTIIRVLRNELRRPSWRTALDER